MSVNKVSFDFERIYGISLVPLVPRDPRCEWSRWRSFSLCFAGVLRGPPPNPPYQPLVGINIPTEMSATNVANH